MRFFIVINQYVMRGFPFPVIVLLLLVSFFEFNVVWLIGVEKCLKSFENLLNTSRPGLLFLWIS